MKLPREIAGGDSAWALAVALARFLHGRDTPPPGRAARHALAAAAARLPQPLRQAACGVLSGAGGGPPERMATLDVEALYTRIAAAYPRRRHPAVVIGSASGALVHLCAALGVPWLPQTVALPVRHRDGPPDGPHAVDRAARDLLDRHPDLVLLQGPDPGRGTSCFRIRRTRLGAGYRRLLIDRLPPGGTIVLAECGQRWPVRTLGDRHRYQLGAPGRPQPADPWPRGADDAPEGEWGFEAELEEDVRRFADRHGFRVRRLDFDGPEDLSAPVADLYRWWHRRRGLPANRLIVDSFTLLDPWWTLRTGSAPYWTLGPVPESLAGLDRYLDATGPWDHLLLAAFSHGVPGPGAVTAERWCEVLCRARLHGAFAGVSPHRYPSDPMTPWHFGRALREIPERHPMPAPLTLDTVAAFLTDHAARYPRVRLEAATVR
ncbi:hypothetical protein [Actinoplanes teichomyceticus]|uniref:Uncharacterized protein n=1 Tax=Actinoplanes teichomyceticus TaxID=1867 RepID=A0A561VM16_ACTTI|nr:hypothetical protein [Actinoplanes teichomyceticus]TWG12632.1 hypothetical protein FHX34_105499 [Actinoplanes teichomyceticus]GIF14002.1 hypothetical protein Ate01nite_40340 [Actinoplanes teichomyceticus]